MKWKKYSFVTRTDAVDLISATLDEAGIEGIEIEDHVALSEEDTKGMFIDILPDLGVDDGTATISFYLDPDDENTDIPAKLAEVKEALNELREYAEIGECLISESETEDKDWINNWKQFFKPLTIGNILIKPSWEDIPVDAEDKILIEIDPGTAFGTGGHETTKLCIMQLQKYIHGGEEVLDVGTGSGILGIAALKLGAKHVYGTDLDDNAIDAVHENTAVNGITEDQFGVICGNVLDDKETQDAAGYAKYDVAVANILAPVIIMLVDEIGRHLKDGATFITSGIIDMKEEDVLAAFAKNPHFEVTEKLSLGEWRCITAVYHEKINNI